jgi:hypothetical protein
LFERCLIAAQEHRDLLEHCSNAAQKYRDLLGRCSNLTLGISSPNLLNLLERSSQHSRRLTILQMYRNASANYHEASNGRGGWMIKALIDLMVDGQTKEMTVRIFKEEYIRLAMARSTCFIR